MQGVSREIGTEFVIIVYVNFRPKTINIFRSMLHSLKIIFTFIPLCISVRTCHHQACVSYYLFQCACLSVFGTTASSGPEPSHSQSFWITHNDAPQSVGFLWTSDQLVAETCTWQHTQHSQQKNVHAPSGIRTYNLSRWEAADLQLRSHSHCTVYTFQNHWLLFIKTAVKWQFESKMQSN